MSADYIIVQAAELPALQRTWLDADGDPVDLSGSTLTLRIGTPTPILKSTGVTGDANGVVTITWTAGELDSAPVGIYSAQVWARVGGLDRVMPLSIEIRKQVPVP